MWSWWDSLEAVERFSFWMFMVLSIGLVLGAVDTISTRLAGRQLDRLKAQRDTAQRAELRHQLSETQQELAEQRAQECAAREYRRSAPIARVELAAEAPYQFFVQIISDNLIPFECTYMVMIRGNLLLTGIPIEPAKAFPPEGNRISWNNVSVGPQRIRDNYLELRSLAPEHHALPGHHQTIIKKYMVAANGGLLPAE